ncbi:vomeronasal type-2 receptor 1-like [Spea bombifrons]|uniref:vomeronasal type-2 receptor 1-like n=1 Tax=Spea bombifrons TaxID=233779 RepID=UPI00234A4B24|nr:vomeronasal type-2 receptor 1-like [Spea bombifrons]
MQELGNIHRLQEPSRIQVAKGKRVVITRSRGQDNQNKPGETQEIDRNFKRARDHAVCVQETCQWLQALRDFSRTAVRADGRPFYLWYAHVRIFLFAIEQINNYTNILPNITLGYHLYDSCLDTRKAVKSILQILSGPGKTIPNYSCSERGKVAGFIGDHYSVTTVPIAQILGIYGHTQISYGATDYSLSDRRVYPHFFRALQNERVHFLIISDLLKHFGWTWVGIFTSDDDGGNQQSLILTKYLNDQGICVAYTIHSNKGIKNDLHHISETVRKSSAQVIVICGPLTYASISTLLVLKDIFHSKTLILPPSSASKTEVFLTNIGTFNGSLGIEHSPIFFSGTENYFKDIKPSKFLNDGLLADIYSLYFKYAVNRNIQQYAHD